MRSLRLPIAMGITILLIVNLLIYGLGLRILSIIGVVLILLSYVIVALNSHYSWHLFIIIEAYSVIELFLVPRAVGDALLLSLLVISALIIFLSLSKLIDIRIFLISLIVLSLSVVLTYYIYSLLGHVMTMYMIILGINTNYFTLMLASSLSIFILFLVILLLKRVIPAFLCYEEK
ncbi:hypothetical protein [Vulcanisaeta moutnovskia]|uniref:hypothetical protein n=1 Tax=Vulcanisaeta moutnovskia TaxID=985052 RepID=UPI0011D04E94|nr:hypothetical protein [Vulcanisaeta moutnovskia]